jgi:hypothetical protein
MSINQIDAAEFRQKIAGFVSPILPDTEVTDMKEAAINLCCILADVFGEDLDRKTLWERIGNGISVCSIKCNGDWEMLLEGLLEYVKSDFDTVSRNNELESWIDSMSLRTKEWTEQFVQIINTKRMFIIVKARNEYKKGRRNDKNI